MIVYFLILNTLIFLPAYLLNWKKSTFLPLQLIDRSFTLNTFLANFIRRYNFDIFRMAGDFAFITLMLFVFKSIVPITFVKILVYAYILIAIFYQTYYHSIKYIYNTEPLFINDVILLKRGLSIAFHGFKFRLIVATIVLLLSVFLIKQLSDVFVLNIYNFKTTPYLFISFLAFAVFCSLYSINRYVKFKSVYGFLCFIMPTIKLLENVLVSIKQKERLKQLKQLDYVHLNQTNTLQLNVKRNIFFIAVESYGKIIFDCLAFPIFNKLIETLDNELCQSGWKASTTFSESPISGGTSWLSYSTLLKGMHIGNESIYSYLFSDEKHLIYQPFMQHLQNNGYNTHLLSSIGGYEKMKIPWQKTLKFLGLKNLIKYKNLSYSGKHFGFGPSPPDQYSLHKAHSIIKENRTNNPFALFWLTLNSHYPWDSPEHIVDDWQLLNQKKDNYWINSDLSTQKKYEKAIMYQLQFLINFILKEGTEDDIFILVGDHQPFYIGEIKDKNTPLHIISKDKKFMEAFENYGFNKGLLLSNVNQGNLKHSGIQSLLIKVLNQVYGNSTSSTYYRNGINDLQK